MRCVAATSSRGGPGDDHLGGARRRCRTARRPRPGTRADDRRDSSASSSVSAPRAPSASAACARSVASSLIRDVSRSASRRELANTIVERCSPTRSSSALLHRRPDRGLLRRAGGRADRPPRRTPARARCRRRRARPGPAPAPRRGPDRLRRLGCTISHRASRREERDATSSTGRTVAESPMRCAGASSSSSSRSRRQREVRPALGGGHGVHLVDDHRVDPAQRLARRRGEQQEQRLRRGDEHVRRRAVEAAPLVGRGVAGAQPTVTSGSVSPRRCAAWRIPASGERRLRCTSTVSAFIGDTYSTRQRRVASSGAGAVASRSSAQRNAASVLPEPVGATTSACCPSATASQAPSCAAVAPSNAPVNQSRVAGEKPSRTAAGRRGAEPSEGDTAPWCPAPPTTTL